jgi:hypothetical protein
LTWTRDTAWMPFRHVRVSNWLERWIDGDSGFESKRLIDNRHPITAERAIFRRRHKYALTFCRQQAANPHIALLGERDLLVSTYGSPSYGNLADGRPDHRLGDAVMIWRYRHDQVPSVDRRHDPVLSYPPDSIERNFWPDVGNLGTGMAMVKVPGLYLGITGAKSGTRAEGQMFYAWARSRDGFSWEFEGIDGQPTSDPTSALRLIDYSPPQARSNGHVAAHFDGEWIYVWFGQIRHGRAIYLVRIQYDGTHPFGRGKMQMWRNLQRAYEGDDKGEWIDFEAGPLPGEAMMGVKRHCYLPDAIDPVSAATLDIEGQPMLALLYQSRDVQLSPHIHFRLAKSMRWPFRWSGVGQHGLDEPYATGFMAALVGAPGIAWYQAGRQLWALWSTVKGDDICSRGVRAQPGGLLPVRLQMFSGAEWRDELTVPTS